MINRSVLKIPALVKPLVQALVLVGCTLGVAQAEVGNPRVNQLGYIPNGDRIAVYKASNNSAQTWQLTHNGSLIASGQTIPKGSDASSGDNIHHIDLSSVTATGRQRRKNKRKKKARSIKKRKIQKSKKKP